MYSIGGWAARQVMRLRDAPAALADIGNDDAVVAMALLGFVQVGTYAAVHASLKQLGGGGGGGGGAAAAGRGGAEERGGDAQLRLARRRHVWSEVVRRVRSSAKALVIPYGITRVASSLHAPPTFGAVLALSYLVPWIAHSAFMADAWVSEYRRGQDLNRGEAGGGGGSKARGKAGGAAAAVAYAASPPRIFLAKGDACAICLEEFTAEAVTAVTDHGGGGGEEPAAALRALTPPVWCLRCGHALHAECLSELVDSARRTRKSVRCPCCREPATLAGAAAARLFE